ncbi:MAG TPA: TetR/AcrR family transcriptional regulator [Trebonia sp.]
MSTRTTGQPAGPAPGTAEQARERNRRGHGAELRADILIAARALLDETGNAEDVTLRAVARRVGITAPSIYAHFPGRQALLLALVQDSFEELRDQLQAAADGTSSPASHGDPAERLHAVCTAYLDFAATRPQHYRLMFGGLWIAAEAISSSAASRDQVAALGQDALAVFISSMQACVAAGRSASTNPHADAIALWLGLHGLAHQRAVTVAFPWPADIADRLVTSLAQLTADLRQAGQ